MFKQSIEGLISRWIAIALFGVVGIALVSWFAPSSKTAAVPVFPPGFVNEIVIGNGLELPTAMAFGPSGSIFVADKSGIVRVWQNEAWRPEPFIDLQDEVNQNADRGLIGLALHPKFPAQPFVYLLYVYDPPGVTPDGEGARVARLLRVTADAENPFVASSLPDAQVVLLGKNSTLPNIGNSERNDDQERVACQNKDGYVQDCLPDDFPAHTIGTVAFGPDGMLYVGNGDGASWKNVDARALRVQSLNSLAGKLLRIDPLTGAGLPDNPFFDGNAESNASKVFDYGLRSPFRFTFHPRTGEPFIGDVGWGTWEEIDVGRGKNFGWPCYEGGDGANERQTLFADNPLTSGRCQQVYEENNAQPPLYAYGRDNFGASVTMGVFYTGKTWPEKYRGALFIADYNNNWIKYLTFDEQGRPTVNPFSSDVHPVNGVVQMLMGPDEQLYYITLGESSGIYRLRYTTSNNQPPRAKAAADVTQGVTPLTVHFSSEGSSDPESQPLTYDWSFGDGTSSTEANPRKTYETSGNFRARLTVTDAGGLTHFDELEIVVGNSRPTLTVEMPVADLTYQTGDTIRLRASARDVEDGDLSARIQWKALLHHGEHTHFDFFSAIGSEAAFAVPDHGDDTRFEICANVMDSQAASSQTVCRELRPATVNLEFTSVPAGVQINYEGVSRLTPFTVVTVANSEREVSAPATFNGLNFTSWSSKAARSHRFNTGKSDRTLTVYYDTPAPQGLRGEYFDNADLTVRRFTRLDDNIDFDWGMNAPDSRLGRDSFSVRWRGQVQPLFTETYTFSTLSDDGVRLWVNGELLINNWSNHNLTEDSATITLQAFERYDIQLEYYDRLGTAMIQLLWASPSQDKEIIPASRMSQPVVATSLSKKAIR